MKKFLEEYGFVILIAIVVILLIVMATPIGNTIKSSVLNLVDSFGSKTVAKIDKTDKEIITTLKGSELTVESKSETDKYIAILRGYQGGREVSVASTDNKLICSDNMTNTATFTDATGAAETADGIAKFIIEDSTKLDENTKYYIEIMNIGTGEIFKSDVSTVDYAKMNAIGGGSGSSGNAGNTLDMSNVDIAGVTGDFSTAGNLVTINSTQYRVLAVNGSQVKVMSMVNVGSSTFNNSSITTSFGSYTGQKYAGSNLDNAMTSYYNSLPSAIQDAIIEQNINQTMYSFTWTVPTGSTATSVASDSDDYIIEKKCEINIGSRKVYALDVDDILEYLGLNFTWKQLNKMVFDRESTIYRDVWLRSAYSGVSRSAFYVSGSGGRLGGSSYSSSGEVRPTFVLNLSLLS